MTSPPSLDDDPMQNVLDEAHELMETLGMSSGDLDEQQQQDDEQLSDSLVIDGFAIDSDDDDEPPASSSGTKEPLSAGVASKDSDSRSTAAEKNNGIQRAQQTQQQQQQQQQQQPLHPLLDDVLLVSPPSTPTSTYSTATTATTTATNNTTGIPSLNSAGSNPSFDLKAKTSLFASNLATFAQKAASQVADQINSTTTAAATSTAHHMGGLATQHEQALATNVPTNVEQQQQQQQELDNDQKARLIRQHVGPLLPGERVIMFLQNLLHVGDSSCPNNMRMNDGVSSFSKSASASLPSCCWYGCMTYYRIILFCVSNDGCKDNNGETKKAAHGGSGDFSAARPPAEWNPHVWSLPTPPKLLQIPLASIDKVEKNVYASAMTSTTTTNSGMNTLSNNNGGTTTTLMGLIIYGKDNGRYLRFTTPSYADTQRVYEALNTYAFPGRRNLGYLFAFESKRNDVMQSIVEDKASGTKRITLPPTRKRFDALVEFHRQFRQLQVWTCWTQINAQYQLCLSYPSVLAGPASLQEASPEGARILRGSASFRSEQRLPCLTWSCGIDGASLWRASQPKVGLQGNRSTADEVYLKHIAESAMTTNALRDGPRPTLPSNAALQHLTGSRDLKEWTLDSANCQLKIMDLRPKSSAMANRTGGYGYENTSYYTGTTIQFCNIGNIHAVRDSYQKMSALCLNPSSSDVQWSQLVEDTKWLSHIRLILAASWETAFWIHVHRLPVMLHCSHGWDRTGQVAVLAQLLLDPHYRTREGFSCLVEKDFMSFGHPFHTRCAHGEGRGERDTPSGNSGDEGQISPIFIQFIDCVYQIVNQYPECFEFNTKYLLVMSEHVYSSRFGTMLCDTERERELVAGIRQRTNSLWDYLDERDDLKNPSFRNDGGVLLMPLPTLLRNVALWVDRHCMFGPKPTMRSLPAYLARPPPVLASDQQSSLHMKDDCYKLTLQRAEQARPTEND